MRKITVVLFLLLVLFTAACQTRQQVPAQPAPAGKGEMIITEPGLQEEQPQETTPASAPVEEKPAEKKPVEISVIAKRFSFSPDPIRVKKGDRVILKITSMDVEHGFAIPAFGINKPLPPGQEVVIEFTADKTGTFDVFCSVYCGTGHKGMKGKLVVE